MSSEDENNFSEPTLWVLQIMVLVML